MPDTRWTLDPRINAFLETMELPPAPFWEQLMAERKPLELAAPQEGDPAPSAMGPFKMKAIDAWHEALRG